MQTVQDLDEFAVYSLTVFANTVIHIMESGKQPVIYLSICVFSKSGSLRQLS